MAESEISEIKEMIQKYKLSLPKLKIFLLGPGQDNVDRYAVKCYNKRCEIKEIFNNDHDNVFFPEDIYEVAKDTDIDVSNATAFEVSLLREEADIIIMIFVLNAPGLQAELNIFSQHQDIIDRICVFYDSSYYSRGADKYWHINDALNSIDDNHGMTKPYTEEDLDICFLLGKVKEIIEKKRRVFSMMPFKKYGEVR